MIRTGLSFSVSGLVLAAGVYAACVQSENFARGASLHKLQLDSEWCLRQATQLRAELEGERFESTAPVPLPDAEFAGPDDLGPDDLRRAGEVSAAALRAGQGGTL